MRNFTKSLCVVLALIVAVSAASCSLSKEYSYKTDDVELPIGVYIYYLRNAYYEAQTLAQQSDKYDSDAQTYDGEKSFLKLEITDEDGKTAVAEDWIKARAEELMNEAVAIYHDYNKLGATLDEAAASTAKSSYRDYWDKGYSYYGYQQPALKDTFEPLGVAFDSFFQAEVTLRQMRDAVFLAEYGEKGAQPVTDEELHKYFEEKYTSYHYFSADLYTTDEDNENTALSDAEIAKLTASFDGYAAAVNGGAKFAAQLNAYNKDYSASATSTDTVSETAEIGKSTSDLMKAIAALKDGEAKQIIIGSEDDSRKIYLIYKDAIKDVTESYFGEDGHHDEVLSSMKSKDFDALLQKIAGELDIKKSSACDSYKPSMFES